MASPSPAEPGWDLEESPFHEGELRVQQRLGVDKKIDVIGRRSVRRYLTAQHQTFFPLLPIAFFGSVGADGHPVASFIEGPTGFIEAPDAHHLRVNALPHAADDLNANLHPGAALALLGIELSTRRRNRAIGIVDNVSTQGFMLSVQQTMGICQKYIQAREASFAFDPPCQEPRTSIRRVTLDDASSALIARADTFFIASNDPLRRHEPRGGPDVSHRGGRPGFVRIDDERTLTTPDFLGNSMFNTIGNIAVDPRVGLLFLDFDHGHFLQISAEAEVIWEGADVEAFAGAQRLIRFHLSKVSRVDAALSLKFSPPSYSPSFDQTAASADPQAPP
jgi:predicted pyridoxine 5'-phosphate oxidase superfamily flavin-nucleotide-binding protein